MRLLHAWHTACTCTAVNATTLHPPYPHPLLRPLLSPAPQTNMTGIAEKLSSVGYATHQVRIAGWLVVWLSWWVGRWAG